ncbi:MAG: hypothetical protein DRI44_09840, partial [Chlamydiae bacterium]
SGFLGKIVFPILSSKYNVTGLCHTNDYDKKFIQTDITNSDELLNLLDKFNPEIIVHSAACREPDICDKNPDLAYNLNVGATEIIGEWAARNSVKLVYISTDYVFDGNNPPYYENSQISPLNVYGKTKAAGEFYVRNVENHIIVRIPLQYGFSVSGEDSLISKIIVSLNQNNTFEINNNQVRYPTFSDDVGYAILDLLEMDFKGTIHLSSSSGLTRYEIWREVADVFGLANAKIIPTNKSVKQFAPRPLNSHLSTKLYDSLNLYKFHTFREGLEIIKNKSAIL